MLLSIFNTLEPVEAAAAVRPAVDVDRWVDAVVDGRPYASLEALLAHAAQIPAFTDQEIAAALAHHPRIGEKPKGDSAEAELSRSEQAGVGVDRDAQLAQKLAEGNAAYEARFDRVFLIRAAGRSVPEILENLERRLGQDEATENAEVADQLAQIALLRLKGIVEADAAGDARSHITTHVLDTGTGRPASGVKVTLEANTDSGWQEIGRGETDDDGRIKNLGPTEVAVGHYRCTFDTGAYYGNKGTETFFPAVVIEFLVADELAHYHVPLLISPFAYSTYRGS